MGAEVNQLKVKAPWSLEQDENKNKTKKKEKKRDVAVQTELPNDGVSSTKFAEKSSCDALRSAMSVRVSVL